MGSLAASTSLTAAAGTSSATLPRRGGGGGGGGIADSNQIIVLIFQEGSRQRSMGFHSIGSPSKTSKAFVTTPSAAARGTIVWVPTTTTIIRCQPRFHHTFQRDAGRKHIEGKGHGHGHYHSTGRHLHDTPHGINLQHVGRHVGTVIGQGNGRNTGIEQGTKCHGHNGDAVHECFGGSHVGGGGCGGCGGCRLACGCRCGC
mmetsp:Transcript_16537/g.45447  ORF Transcript_16537/g.45447 Transcript_16537/m.45447 type:complete len:201 (+) Transcript_16537:559-1161(+)